VLVVGLFGVGRERGGGGAAVDPPPPAQVKEPEGDEGEEGEDSGDGDAGCCALGEGFFGLEWG